ncbi:MULTISPECIES: barstar family protein [Paenibacillus]|uniref:barstar family protein n=1 Tax=Paenibacillus TaxID=44249 RepID=UPI000589DCBF|nr:MULTISPECIES: barstar family protein [Paenibacillus]AJE50448.1 barnase inhibitor [Paenibacillus polymyxa]QOH61169.1 barnase inhibitor [Paenibacillus polymyxa]
MRQRFAVMDDESGLTVGYCRDVVGLTGDIMVGTNEKVIFEQFEFNEEFIENIAKTKQSVSNLYIAILDDEEKVIGSYHYHLPESYIIHKLNYNKGNFNLELTGILETKPSSVELRLWELLKCAQSLENNIWQGFSKEERSGWLNVTRIHSASNCFQSSRLDKRGEVYTLDGKHIFDFTTFFIALGEAINGPGGYFGFSLDSISDCLCGGFGAVGPFTIHWQNAHYFLERFEEEWDQEERYYRFSPQQYFMDLLTILVSGGVTVNFSSN